MKSKHELLTFETVVLAIHGDVNDVNHILQHFERN